MGIAVHRCTWHPGAKAEYRPWLGVDVYGICHECVVNADLGGRSLVEYVEWKVERGSHIRVPSEITEPV